MVGYDKRSDSELITLIEQGDRVAFREVYDRYAMLIFYKVNRMLADDDSSKDIVQDLFGWLWENPGNIRPDSNLLAYLFVASRNRVLKYIQRGKTKTNYLSDLGKYSNEVSEETLERIEEKETMALILMEISKLPPRMQQVFMLSRFENLSHKQIAQSLDISETTVKKQVQKSLAILRAKFSRYDVGGFVLLFLLRK